MHITMPTAHNASTVSHTDNTRHFTVILPSLTNDTAHFWPLVTRRYSRLVAIADWFQQLLLLHPFNGFFSQVSRLPSAMATSPLERLVTNGQK